MSILEQFSNVMSGNADALLNKTGNSIDTINAAILDLQNILADVKKETSDIISISRMTEQKLRDCQNHIHIYTNAIEKAVIQGEVDDARKMIHKKQQFELQLPILLENHQIADVNISKIRKMHDKLAVEIEYLKSRKAVIKSKIHTANIIAESHKTISVKCESPLSNVSVEDELSRVQSKLVTIVSE